MTLGGRLSWRPLSLVADHVVQFGAPQRHSALLCAETNSDNQPSPDNSQPTVTPETSLAPHPKWIFTDFVGPYIQLAVAVTRFREDQAAAAHHRACDPPGLGGVAA